METEGDAMEVDDWMGIQRCVEVQREADSTAKSQQPRDARGRVRQDAPERGSSGREELSPSNTAAVVACQPRRGPKRIDHLRGNDYRFDVVQIYFQ